MDSLQNGTKCQSNYDSVYSQHNEANSPKASIPTVRVSLNGLEKKSLLKKSSSLTSIYIVDRLSERQLITESKLCNLRMSHKAKEMGEMRAAPEINPKSRKIIGEKRKNLQEISEKQAKNKSPQAKFDKNESIYDEMIQRKNSLSILEDSSDKTKEKVKEKIKNASSVNLKLSISEAKVKKEKKIKDKKDVIERTRTWKEKIEKVREEKRKIKDKEEMEQCTFKPNVSPKIEVSQDGTMIKKDYLSGINGFSSKNKIVSKTQQKNNQKSEVLTYRYKQISPVGLRVKHDIAFDFDEFIAKAYPMTSYTLDDDNFNIN